MKAINNIMRIGALAIACCTTATMTATFPSTHFAPNSVLASGKWVKIAIPADGVYELTEQELHEMGFNDINNVQVYGQGGHLIHEKLDGKQIDDLQQVGTVVAGGKLCFYAKGAVNVTLNAGTQPYFSRSINCYSTHGYYFLTEGRDAKDITVIDKEITGSNMLATSLDYFYHEQDMYSYGLTGKDMQGEDITLGASIPFALEQVASNNLTFNVTATAKALKEDVLEGFKIGADDYITKPFNADVLCARIANLIASRKHIDTSNDRYQEMERAEFSSVDRGFINHMHSYVTEHLADADLDVQQLSEEFGMSRVQLYRKCKSITNQSPVEIIRIIRLKAATQLLKTTDKTVAEIAYEVGFSSPSYFAKCYKDQYNVSPTDIQKQRSATQ